MSYIEFHNDKLEIIVETTVSIAKLDNIAYLLYFQRSWSLGACELSKWERVFKTQRERSKVGDGVEN
jgi:hypothetical protein